MNNSHISDTNKVCIIGAGPAGLAAAWELSKNRIPARVFETLSVPGGIARTEVHQGFRADLGGHRFFTRIPMLNDLWQEILGDDFLLRPRLSRILYRNKFYNYPLQIRNVLSNMGIIEASLCVLSYLRVKMFPPEEIITFEDWITARFGSRLFKMFFKTYTEKVWGIPCASISADWAAQRIKNLSLREAVKNALMNQAGLDRKTSVTSLIEQFHYPRLGPGMMWETLAERLTESGCQVEFGSEVISINHQDNRIVSLTSRRNGTDVTCPVGACISSMPLSELVFSMNPAPPDEVLNAARGLGYRDYIAVNLIIDESRIFPDNWIYVHDPEVELGRIQNYKNWSPEMVPVPGKTVLGLEYFHFETDPEWNWEDERLIERGKEELNKLGIAKTARVESGWVTRVPKAYPVYDSRYKDCLAVIRNYLEGFENLQAIGRNGTHRYNNMDHSMLSGIYAASNILGENINLWDVNTEEEYHETVDASLEEAVELVLNKIDPTAAGAGAAVTLGLFMSLLTLFTLYLGDESTKYTLSLLANYFYGYSVSWSGSAVILLESGLAGFLGGSVFAWMRNTIMRIIIS